MNADEVMIDRTEGRSFVNLAWNKMSKIRKYDLTFFYFESLNLKVNKKTKLNLTPMVPKHVVIVYRLCSSHLVKYWLLLSLSRSTISNRSSSSYSSTTHMRNTNWYIDG